MRTVAGIITLVVASVYSAVCFQKPTIVTRLKLVDQSFQRSFTPSEVSYIEGESIDKIIHLLNEHLCFFNFDTTGGTDTLIFQIDKKEKSSQAASSIDEVGFWVKVSGQRVSEGEHNFYWDMLRDRGEYNSRWGDKENVVNKIERVFEQNLELKSISLLDKALRHVLICDKALIMLDRKICVLPFTQNEICVEVKSEFSIVNELKLDIGTETDSFKVVAKGNFNPDPGSITYPEEYKNRIYARLSDDASIPEYKSIKTKEVYLLKFYPFQNSPQPATINR